MRQGLGFGVAALPAIVFAGLTAFGAADDKPKHDVEAIMKMAHDEKTGVYFKVVRGKATDAEKQELVELYVDLGKNKPEKGDARSWREKTDALVTAAKEVAAGKEGAVKALQRAANCQACHDTHKKD
jgi:hypothetical protein